jgi:hypothetical protein
MERSTALNKNLKPPPCNPLGQGVSGRASPKAVFPVFFLLMIADCSVNTANSFESLLDNRPTIMDGGVLIMADKLIIYGKVG